MEVHFLFWVIFAVLFIVVFALDMMYASHHHGEINIKAAVMWSVIWIAAGFAFAILIFYYFPDGHTKSFEYIAAYLIEKSLSVDNLFVFLLIFGAMQIPDNHQHRILMWGIVGAVVLRIAFILVGVELLKMFSFMIYVFGIILVVTAVKMLLSKDEEIHPDDNFFVKLTKKLFPVKTDVNTDHFFVKQNGKLYATLAFITLVLIESTDVIFAVDSIPAVLAITHDPFIAITSNLFAILGLRSLFFALVGILNLFRYLKYGISFILLFIGVKMLISNFVHIHVQISLIVIVATLAISVFASVVIKEDEESKAKRKKKK